MTALDRVCQNADPSCFVVHFSDCSDILRSGTLSIWFGKVPVVILSRHKVHPLVVHS